MGNLFGWLAGSEQQNTCEALRCELATYGLTFLSGKIRTQLAVLTSLVCMSQKKYTMYILHQATEEKGLERIQ